MHRYKKTVFAHLKITCWLAALIERLISLDLVIVLSIVYRTPSGFVSFVCLSLVYCFVSQSYEAFPESGPKITSTHAAVEF